MKKPNGVVIIGIVFLGLKHQEGEKIGISPQHFQALDNVPSKELERFASPRWRHWQLQLQLWLRIVRGNPGVIPLLP